MPDQHQIWGTFSVKDHVRPGAFIAEVLMYDRLVLPVPPNRKSGDAEQRKKADKEWERWEKNDWQPERQTKLAKILGKQAYIVEWTGRWEEMWGKEFERRRGELSGQVARELAYQVTGELLLKVRPRMADAVVAVTPYDSLEDMKADLQIGAGQPADDRHREGMAGNFLTAIIGREFLVPDDADRDEFELLKEAVAAAKDTDYRNARAALNGWLKKFMDETGQTDALSIEAAVTDLHKHIEALRKATARQRRWNGVRHCLFIGKTALKVAGAPLNPVEAGKACIAVGEYVSNEALKNPGQPGAALPQGAFFVDAQNRLGLDAAGNREPALWKKMLAKLGV